MQKEIIFKIDWTPNGFVSIGAEMISQLILFDWKNPLSDVYSVRVEGSTTTSLKSNVHQREKKCLRELAALL